MKVCVYRIIQGTLHKEFYDRPKRMKLTRFADLTYMTVLVQTKHDKLPLSINYHVVCEMPQNLAQNTCTANEIGAAALHCGQ